MASSNSGSALRRVIVALKTSESADKIVPAKFRDCVVGYFGQNRVLNSVEVRFRLEDDMLVLYDSPEHLQQSLKETGEKIQTDKESNLKIEKPDWNCRSSVLDGTSRTITSTGNHYDEPVVLQHSPECPMKKLSDSDADTLPEEILTRGIDVGVAVLVESADNRILLTRRASHMRTFPKAWVPPGGHIELNESLVDAGLRELREETGLHVNPKDVKVNFLCLWESVYPTLLGFGLPKRHHIVVYLHLVSVKTWQELQSHIKLDPEEVQSCTWVTVDIVKDLFAKEKEELGMHEMFILQDDGTLKLCELDLSNMYPRMLWRTDKVYSGSQLALRRWLDKVEKNGKIPSKI